MSYAAGLPEGARLEPLASRDTQERIAELEQRAFELGEELARRGEELEAVRQLNLELMAKVNISRPERPPDGPPIGEAPNGERTSHPGRVVSRSL